MYPRCGDAAIAVLNVCFSCTDLCAVLHGGVDSGAALQEENTKLTVRGINGKKRPGNVNHVSFSAEE